MIRSMWRSYPWAVNMSGGMAHTVPLGRVAFFGTIPGNKLPGYLHGVPPGRRHLASVHEFPTPTRVLPTLAFFDKTCSVRGFRWWKSGILGYDCAPLRPVHFDVLPP